MKPVQFKIKESDPIQGDEEEAKPTNAKKKKIGTFVATKNPEPSVAIETKTKSSSLPISFTGLAQAFFRSKLHQIKETQANMTRVSIRRTIASIGLKVAF